MNVRTALSLATHHLNQIGIESPSLEARMLLAYAFEKNIEYILINSSEELNQQKEEYFSELLRRRTNLEPIAYILGIKEFYGREFEVNNKVLIPRPATEILVDTILATNFKSPNILELGTGSGCIIITLLLEQQVSTAVASDISLDALLVAEKNAAAYNVLDKLTLLQSDWLEKIAPQKFDIIVSNPPYISIEEQQYMAQETLLFEPEIALFSEEDGLQSYFAIAEKAKDFLAYEGKLFLEVGFQQASLVIDLFTKKNYKFEASYKDLSGYIRVVQFGIE